MSESERDIPNDAGELATRTPPDGAPAVEPAAPDDGRARAHEPPAAETPDAGAPAPPAALSTEEHLAVPPGEDPYAPAPPAALSTEEHLAVPPGEDPYAHHAYGAAAPAAPTARRRGRRARRAAPAPDPPLGDGSADGEPEDWDWSPVIPLDRPSLLDLEPSPANVRIRKLRVLGVLLGLGILAVVSTIFGMMMAVTSNLPRLEARSGANSVLTDRNGKQLGLLTGNQKRIFLKSQEIAPVMKQAIIAIEDRRFYTNAGIDLRGIGRALYQDIRAQKAVQGGSTITMQFVKNALAAQDERTLFNKLREAAIAYEITRRWSKERILRNYLNTIYFGNGAYGIESAARTYFGSNHPGCGEDGQPKCAQVLAPAEAALIAGLVASPSGYDPLMNREAAAKRRGLVLDRMIEQGYLTPGQRAEAQLTSLPTSKDIQPPAEDTAYPYFTSWVKQQVVDKLGGGQEGARRAFEGGLTVQTTLDARLQEAAEQAVTQWLPWQEGPRASLVAIDNRSGEVLAMVGGDDYATRPFNLATQGQRQPGSAFKPFVLAAALGEGISPDSTWTSQKVDICITRKKGKCVEYFDVNNYEDAYGGIRTLRTATTYSDNSVYAQLGVKIGTRKIARLARRVGIRTPVSHNSAITLGGLKQGVTPLDMAHAYQTFARGGRLTWSSMSPGAVERSRLGKPVPGPAGIRAIGKPDAGKLKPIKLPNGEKAEGKPDSWPVLKSSVAEDVSAMLSTVVAQGTATRAQISGVFTAGKTGTTENYGDAWFVGWTHQLTVAVWVGYPDELKPMTTEFNGQPVAGGTYPAAIWKSFVEAALKYDEYAPEEEEDDAPLTPAPDAPVTPGTPAPTTPAPEGGAPSGEGGGAAPETAPVDPVAAPPAEQPPAEQPAPTDTGGATAPAG